MTTDGRQPLRIKSARLAAPSSVTVLSARKSDAEPIVSPYQLDTLPPLIMTFSRHCRLHKFPTSCSDSKRRRESRRFEVGRGSIPAVALSTDDMRRRRDAARPLVSDCPGRCASPWYTHRSSCPAHRSFDNSEITFIVQTRVRTALTDTPFSHLCPTVAEIVLAQAVGSSELDQYAHKVRIRLPSIEASSWEGHFRELVPNNEQRLKLTELVMTATSVSHQAPGKCDSDLTPSLQEPLEKSASDAAPWRSLTIPVDLPSISVGSEPPRDWLYPGSSPTLQILNVVSATFPAGATTTSGRPLALRFTIKSSFRWATPEVYEALTKTPVDMLFDVHAHHLDWVLSGIDRGSFTATVSSFPRFSATRSSFRRPGRGRAHC